MAYEKFSVYDFTMDQSFKEWVNNPNSDEGRFWKKWLEENPDKEETVQEARQLILLLDFGTDVLSPTDVDELWQKLEQRIDKKNSLPADNNHKRKSKYSRGKPLLKWAAVFVGFLLISISAYLWLDYRNTATYITDFGVQKTVQLPDGSTAILNANSILKYRSGWLRGGQREVWLKGEALFSVVRTTDDQTFTVHTSDLGVEVLGTEFSVKQREKGTKVVLNAGQVMLRLPDPVEHGEAGHTKEIIMTPGDLVEYNEEKKTLAKNKVDTRKHLAWSENKLVFDDTPLGEIITLLEDNYGFEVMLQKEEWKTKTFTATYPADQVEILLGALSKAFDLHIQQQDKVLYINKTRK